MPVITAQNRGTIGVNGSDISPAPRRAQITANTSASLIHTPFSTPDKEEVAGEEPVENGQANTPRDESETPQEAVTLSPQLTALARREQKFRQQEQAFKAKQAEVEAQIKELAELKALKSRIESKDWGALEQQGLTYDEYTQYKLNEQENQKPEVQAVNELREELNSLKSEQKKNEEKQFEQIKGQYRTDIKALVSKDPRFESIKERGAEDHVLQHIMDTFNEDEEVLSVEQACQEVEDAILEEALSFAKLKKVQAKLAPTPAKPTLPPPQRSNQLRTLTQQIAPSSRSSTSAQFQHLSPRERLAQALAKAQKPPQ